MAKHLCTGVAGFVGSNLVRRLLKEGHQVWGVDSLICGFMENMNDFIDHPNFKFRAADIRAENVCDNIIKPSTTCGTLQQGVRHIGVETM